MCALLFESCTAMGAGPSLSVNNQNPLVRIYGLPPSEGAELLASGKSTSSLIVDVANNFSENETRRERIWLDGESAQTTFRWRQGIAEGWQWGFDLPWLYQSGGTFDSFIVHWHDLFALPQGNRKAYKENQLNYLYQRDGQQQLAVTGHSDGIGDLRLHLARQLYVGENQFWALQMGVKFATGDEQNLHGSGRNDISVGVNYADHVAGFHQGYSRYAGVGLLWMDGSEVLQQIHRDYVVYGHAGFAWHYSPQLQFNLQLDGHTAFYDSDLRELGPSMQLTIGGQLQLAAQWRLHLGVVEDIVVESAPDVIFHLRIDRNW